MEGKEKRVEEKEVEKREKGKSGFGKSPFGFCLTVCLPLPFFFPALTTPQHTLTLTHHTPHNMTHWCTPSHANRAMCCAAFLGVDSETHTASSTLHHLTSCNRHQPNTNTAHGASNNEMTTTNENGDLTKGKVGQQSSTNTPIEVTTTTQ